MPKWMWGVICGPQVLKCQNYIHQNNLFAHLPNKFVSPVLPALRYMDFKLCIGGYCGIFNVRIHVQNTCKVIFMNYQSFVPNCLLCSMLVICWHVFLDTSLRALFHVRLTFACQQHAICLIFIVKRRLTISQFYMSSVCIICYYFVVLLNTVVDSCLWVVVNGDTTQ